MQESHISSEQITALYNKVVSFTVNHSVHNKAVHWKSEYCPVLVLDQALQLVWIVYPPRHRVSQALLVGIDYFEQRCISSFAQE